ncbi:MAG: aminomethyl transferase family protein [Gammaproteobacteria bacterium]|nr:aminomethyl transferase family protein [Gammaproteobacteria bacterium]
MTHSKLVHAKSHPTVRITSKRFEQSPYAPKYADDDTLYGIYCSRFYPISFGENVIEQYWKLRREVMLFDVPEKPLSIKGAGAIALLNRVFTRRIDNLEIGRAHYAIACTPQGGIQMDGVMIRLADDHFWYVQANGEFISWLVAFSEGLEVSLSDPKSRVLQIQGPKSLEVLKAMDSNQDIDTFGYFHAGRFDIGGQSVLVTRTGWTGELGFEIYGNCYEPTDYSALWDTIIEAGKPFGLENTALEVMGMRRIEAGILDYSTDIDNSMTPFDIGLGNFVDFSKDDFVGRSALQTASRDTRLFGLSSATGVPSVGCEVLDKDTKVGEVRVGDWSPTLEKGIGYVFLDQPTETGDGWLGRQLTLVDKEGTEHDSEVGTLPFFDAEKNIPRGKNSTEAP